MAVTFADLYDGQSGTSHGTGTWTSGSFTPTSGRRLVAIAAMMEQDGNSDPTGDMTIADSQGLTWTAIGSVAGTDSWAIGMKAWISTAAAASSTTIDLDAGTRNSYNYFLAVFEVAGSGGTTDGFVSDTTAGNDSYTVTLAATPTADDLCVFANFLDASVSGAGLDMGTGWTVIAERYDASGGGVLGVAVDDALASTTVTVDDAHIATGGEAYFKAVDFAFIVKASAGAYTLDADPGSLTISGQAAGIEASRLLTADAGSLTLTGQDVALDHGFTLAAEPGALTLSGQDAALTIARTLTAESGGFNVSGIAAALVADRTLTADPGAFVITGQDAALEVDTDAELVADPGSFTIAGQDAALAVARLLTADSGSLTLTGQDVELAYGRTLAADPGVLTLDGQDVAFALARTLSADAGSFTLTGTAAALTYSAIDTASPIVNRTAVAISDASKRVALAPADRVARTAIAISDVSRRIAKR